MPSNTSLACFSRYLCNMVKYHEMAKNAQYFAKRRKKDAKKTQKIPAVSKSLYTFVADSL